MTDQDRTMILPRHGGRRASEEPDRTLIRPRPASGRADPPRDDATVVRPRAGNGRQALQLQALPAGQRKSLADIAATLLQLSTELGQAHARVDVRVLHRQVSHQIQDFRQRAEQAGFPAETVRKASYLLCTLLDETVLNSSWGEHSQWSQKSMLRLHHGETYGGESAFRMIDEALGAVRKDGAYLEIAYLCLGLGFQGKFRIDRQGRLKIEQYREDLYRELIEARDNHRRELSPDAAVDPRSGGRLLGFTPVWVLASVLATIGFGAYLFMLTALNRGSDQLMSAMAELVPPPETETAMPAQERPLTDMLKELLASEMEQGAVRIEDGARSVTLTLQAGELFESASADISPAYGPVLDKIARSLEAVPGRVVIAGHSDSRAIRTVRYPSNWHLSLARANAVAHHMAETGNLAGRLIPEGRSDTQPVADNETAEGRARNRRVTIEIAHSGER
ncbi:MAG: type VI secretion system protein TssL, long form [Ectothiorhodospiraceae bacterium]|nr:type VI secretion system protein TssL, long form [Ectothiorhodospiraceae bacterium]